VAGKLEVFAVFTIKTTDPLLHKIEGLGITTTESSRREEIKDSYEKPSFILRRDNIQFRGAFRTAEK